LASASQMFAEVRQLVEGAHRPDEVRWLGRAVLLAAAAYVSYRQGRYALARQQVQEALGLDLRLEEDYGYDILHLHRITLISNLARIVTREEGPERGVRPLVDILLYMEGARPGLESLTPSNVSIDAMPPHLVLAMMYGFASDLAVFWAGLGPARAAPLLPVLRPVALERATARFQPLIAGAFGLKGALPDGPDVRPGGPLLSALAAGRRAAPRLWYTLVADLAHWLAGSPAAGARGLREEIAQDAAGWPDLPPVLRPELAAPAPDGAPRPGGAGEPAA